MKTVESVNPLATFTEICYLNTEDDRVEVVLIAVENEVRRIVVPL